MIGQELATARGHVHAHDNAPVPGGNHAHGLGDPNAALDVGADPVLVLVERQAFVVGADLAVAARLGGRHHPRLVGKGVLQPAAVHVYVVDRAAFGGRADAHHLALLHPLAGDRELDAIATLGRCRHRLGSRGHGLVEQVADSLVGRLVVQLLVVEVLDRAGDLLLGDSGAHRHFDQAAVQPIELVGDRHGRVIHSVVRHEEAVGEALGRDAAGVLGRQALAAVPAVHLRALGGLDRRNRQVAVEAAPQEGFLGVGVAQVVRVERQAPRRQAAQLLDPAHRVLDRPHLGLEILDRGEGFLHQLDAGHRPAVLVLGGKVPGPAGGEVRAGAGGQDRVNVLPVEVPEPVAEKLGAEIVHVPDFGVILNVEAVDLIARLFPGRRPLAGQVEQREHHLVGVGAAGAALLARVLLPFGNLGLGLCRGHPAELVVVDLHLVGETDDLVLLRSVENVGDLLPVLDHAALVGVELGNDLAQLTVIHAHGGVLGRGALGLGGGGRLPRAVGSLALLRGAEQVLGRNHVLKGDALKVGNLLIGQLTRGDALQRRAGVGQQFLLDRVAAALGVCQGPLRHRAGTGVHQPVEPFFDPGIHPFASVFQRAVRQPDLHALGIAPDVVALPVSTLGCNLVVALGTHPRDLVLADASPLAQGFLGSRLGVGQLDARDLGKDLAGLLVVREQDFVEPPKVLAGDHVGEPTIGFEGGAFEKRRAPGDNLVARHGDCAGRRPGGIRRGQRRLDLVRVLGAVDHRTVALARGQGLGVRDRRGNGGQLCLGRADDRHALAGAGVLDAGRAGGLCRLRHYRRSLALCRVPFLDASGALGLELFNVFSVDVAIIVDRDAMLPQSRDLIRRKGKSLIASFGVRRCIVGNRRDWPENIVGHGGKRLRPCSLFLAIALCSPRSVSGNLLRTLLGRHALPLGHAVEVGLILPCLGGLVRGQAPLDAKAAIRVNSDLEMPGKTVGLDEGGRLTLRTKCERAFSGALKKAGPAFVTACLHRDTGRKGVFGRTRRPLGGGRAGELAHLLHQLADRRVQANDADVLARLRRGKRLMVTVEHIAVRRHEHGAVAALELGCLLHLAGRELGLRRLERGGRHLLLLMRDAARVQEVDHGAAVLGLHLRHFGARDAKGLGLLGEPAPIVVARRRAQRCHLGQVRQAIVLGFAIARLDLIGRRRGT